MPARSTPGSTVQAALYYSILIQTMVGKRGQAFEEARSLRIHPIPDVDFLPYDVLRWQAEDLRRQIAASTDRAGWRPAALINSMPRSASSYVSSIMSTMLDVPIGRVTLGNHPQRILVEPWLKIFLNGNCVTHDHLVPSTDVLSALERTGVTDLFFQFRDPRETAWSGMQQLGPAAAKPDYLAQLKQEIEYMVGWLGIIDSSPPFRVHLVDYRQVRDDPVAAFSAMLEAIGQRILMEDLKACLAQAHANLSQYNFRRGDSNEWRRELPLDVVDAADRMVPDYVRQFMDRTAEKL